MNIIDQILKSKTTQHYWEKILGKELLNDTIKHRDIYMDHILEKEQIPLDRDFLHFMCSTIVTESDDLFWPFTERLSAWIQRMFKALIPLEGLFSRLYRNLSQQMIGNLKWLYLRCLIVEMQRLKSEGLLHGQKSVQEYEYFLENYLQTESYMKKFLEKYPVMTQLIAEKVQNVTLYLREISENLIKDKDMLELRLCHGHAFHCVEAMDIGLSDEHFPGKSVARLTLDNGYTIYYKPRSSEAVTGYQELHRWLLNGCGMDSFTYAVLNGKEYAWEAEVAEIECGCASDVEEFYYRMGIQLCLTYVLKISDLHLENIIAHAKYPVIIDLEIFPENNPLKDASGGRMGALLSDTVLRTGILPTENNTNFENVGGLGLSGDTKASYKLPVVIHPGTSQMRIDYEYLPVKSGKNLPMLNGQRLGCLDYISHVLRGFQSAYEYLLKNKGMFQTLLKTYLPKQSRYLRRNTQQYMMYQNLAGFPDFLRQADSRYLLFMRLKRDDKEKAYCQNMILNYERTSIFHMQIPVFYAKNHALYMGDGTWIDNYFELSADELLIKRLEKLGLKDMQFQIKVIQTSFLNMASPGRVCSKDTVSGTLLLTPEYAADWIINDCIDCDGQLNWVGLHCNAFGKAYLAPVDRYLYSGLSGIAIFMTAMAIEYGDEKYVEISQRLCEQLFRYTDALACEGADMSCQWGLFTGEASIVLTYCILYQMTEQITGLNGHMYNRLESLNCSKFWTYAQKHCDVVLDHMDNVNDADLLDGKAGVLISLLRVYEISGEDKYIQGATYLAGLLEKNAVSMSVGIGWLCKGQSRPLAGMAHGNSGIALAFARLYSFTKKKHYLDIIRQSIRYEDSLYVECYGNWMDMRNIREDGVYGKDTVAWCHGAGGIMAARMAIFMDTGVEFDKTILEKAVEKVRKVEDEKMCLCHGKEGLQLLLQYMGSDFKFSERDNALRVDDLSVEDYLSPGLMTGLAGIGYGLLAGLDLRYRLMILIP